MGLKNSALKKLAKIPGYQEAIHGKFKIPRYGVKASLLVFKYKC